MSLVRLRRKLPPSRALTTHELKHRSLRIQLAIPQLGCTRVFGRSDYRASMAYNACVTGASGFVATELVKRLLEKGYNVNATFRGGAGSNKAAYLIQLAEVLPGRLKVFDADLLVPGSFDAAVSGCQYVFHIASPFQITVDNPEAQLVKPAVEGTKNVMAAVQKHKATVQRVIVTSSVAAVHGMTKATPPVNGSKYTEEDWNTESTVDNGQAYWASKVKAEQEAHRSGKELAVDVITILPNFIIGPVLCKETTGGSLSVGFVKGLLEGTVTSGSWTFSDVRDVARAHILAAELGVAPGRYITSWTKSLSAKDVLDALRERFPTIALPEGEGDVIAKEDIDTSKATAALRLHSTPPSSSIVDMAVTLIQLGIAKPTFK